MLRYVIFICWMIWGSLAMPGGNHTCKGVIRQPVFVHVNVTEPVTFRSYTWCLRVPPRCSKYTMVLKERVKVYRELHNRTIQVCCKGYVEMYDKCFPACPPDTLCPFMHCNKTNHCYCTDGYTGLYCNDPCPKGFWGIACRKPCDCPDGYTCHHLTGDCMLDDVPTKKQIKRTTTFDEPTTLQESPTTKTPKRNPTTLATFTTFPTTRATTTEIPTTTNTTTTSEMPTTTTTEMPTTTPTTTKIPTTTPTTTEMPTTSPTTTEMPTTTPVTTEILTTTPVTTELPTTEALTTNKIIIEQPTTEIVTTKVLTTSNLEPVTQKTTTYVPTPTKQTLLTMAPIITSEPTTTVKETLYFSSGNVNTPKFSEEKQTKTTTYVPIVEQQSTIKPLTYASTKKIITTESTTMTSTIGTVKFDQIKTTRQSFDNIPTSDTQPTTFYNAPTFPTFIATDKSTTFAATPKTSTTKADIGISTIGLKKIEETNIRTPKIITNSPVTVPTTLLTSTTHTSVPSEVDTLLPTSKVPTQKSTSETEFYSKETNTQSSKVSTKKLDTESPKTVTPLAEVTTEPTIESSAKSLQTSRTAVREENYKFGIIKYSAQDTEESIPKLSTVTEGFVPIKTEYNSIHTENIKKLFSPNRETIERDWIEATEVFQNKKPEEKLTTPSLTTANVMVDKEPPIDHITTESMKISETLEPTIKTHLPVLDFEQDFTKQPKISKEKYQKKHKSKTDYPSYEEKQITSKIDETTVKPYKLVKSEVSDEIKFFKDKNEVSIEDKPIPKYTVMFQSTETSTTDRPSHTWYSYAKEKAKIKEAMKAFKTTTDLDNESFRAKPTEAYDSSEETNDIKTSHVDPKNFSAHKKAITMAAKRTETSFQPATTFILGVCLIVLSMLITLLWLKFKKRMGSENVSLDSSIMAYEPQQASVNSLAYETVYPLNDCPASIEASIFFRSNFKSQEIAQEVEASYDKPRKIEPVYSEIRH